MPLRRALALWFMILIADSAHAALHAQYLAPVVGDFAARQWSVLSSSLLTLLITWLMTPWLDARGNITLARIGLLWVALSIGTQIWIGLAMGLSRQRMFEDYDLAQGGLSALGMLLLAFAPWLGVKLQGAQKS